MRNAAKLALAASGVVITGGAALFAMKRPGKSILGSSYANPLPVASSEAPAKRIPNVAPRLREAWKALGLGDMPEAALELALAQAWLESGIAEVKGGSWWKDRTAVGGGDMRKSGNLGAIQCVTGDQGTTDYTCVLYEDSHPDGTKYNQPFRFYSTPEAAARDFIRHITAKKTKNIRDASRPADALAALKQGDVMNYAEVLYNRSYFEGFGKTPAERVRAYAKAIASHLPAVAAALGHDKISAGIGPDLLANQQAKALAGFGVEGTGAVVAVTAAVVGTVAIAAALGAWALKHQAKKDVESIVDRFKMFVPEAEMRGALAKLAAQGLVVVAPGSSAPAGAISNNATQQAAASVLGQQAFQAALSQGVRFFGAPASALPAAQAPQAAPVRRAPTPFKPPRAGKDDAAPGFIGPPAPPPAEEPVNDPANRPDPVVSVQNGVVDLLQRGASSINGTDVGATPDSSPPMQYRHQYILTDENGSRSTVDSVAHDPTSVRDKDAAMIAKYQYLKDAGKGGRDIALATVWLERVGPVRQPKPSDVYGMPVAWPWVKLVWQSFDNAGNKVPTPPETMPDGSPILEGADIADATSDAILLTALAAEQAEHGASKVPNAVVDVLSHGASSIAGGEPNAKDQQDYLRLKGQWIGLLSRLTPKDETNREIAELVFDWQRFSAQWEDGHGKPELLAAQWIGLDRAQHVAGYPEVVFGNSDPKQSTRREDILSSADYTTLSDRGIFVVDSQATEDIPWPDAAAQMRDGPEVREIAAKLLGQDKLDTAYASGYLFTRQVVPVASSNSRARRLSGAYTPELGWAGPVAATLAVATIVSAGAAVVSAHAANEGRKRAASNDKPSGIAGEHGGLNNCIVGEAYQALHLAGALPRARSIPGSGGHFVWYIEVPAGDVARLSGAGDEAFDAGVDTLAQVPFFGLLAPLFSAGKSAADSATGHDPKAKQKWDAKQAAKKKAAAAKKKASVKADQKQAIKTEKELAATTETLKQARSDLSTAQTHMATLRTWVKRHPVLARITNPKLAPIVQAAPAAAAPTAKVEIHGVVRRFSAHSALGSGLVPPKPAEGPPVTDIGAAGDSTKGMLIDAIRAGKHEKPRWTHVPFDGMTIQVATDAVRMPVDKSLLRMPISYQESIEASKLLGGLIVPSARIADAIYKASERGVLNGLVSTAADSAKMSTVGFSKRFNADIDKQFAGKSGLLFGPWKLWILNKRIGEPTNEGPAAVNYGGWNPAGIYRCGDLPCSQSIGGTHNQAHSDYSQLYHPVKRYALAADGSQVDLLDYIEQKEGVSREQTQPFRG